MNQLTKKSRSKKKAKAPNQEWQNIKGAKRERLILERKKKGFTQGQLAKMLNISISMISHIENGRTNPGVDLALGFQGTFNLPFEILFPDL